MSQTETQAKEEEIIRPATAGRQVFHEIAKTGSLDTQLAFLIRIWKGSRALKVSWEVFSVLDEPKMPFAICSWSGRCVIRTYKAAQKH